jgi:cytochrome b involved in lipid metabolism
MAPKCFVLVLIITIFLVGCAKEEVEEKQQPATEPVIEVIEEEQEEVKLTIEEVAKHSSRNDCWLIINERVYDITNFIASHPGGIVIQQGCGKDATMLFETRPMGSGTAHSERARSLRDDYYIGNLE